MARVFLPALLKPTSKIAVTHGKMAPNMQLARTPQKWSTASSRRNQMIEMTSSV